MMLTTLRWVGLCAAAVLAGCLAVAGLDGDYGPGAPAGAGPGTSSGGTAGSVTTSTGGSVGGADGGAGAAAGAGGQGAGATGAGGGAREDCLNGLDDDGDLAIDCDDDSCGDYHCVAAAGNEMAMLVGVDTNGCPDHTTARGLHACAGCSCDANPGSCSFILTGHSDDQCMAPLGTVTAAGCYGIGNGNKFFRATMTPGLAGSCSVAATNGVAEGYTGCQLQSSAGHCAAGGQCVPRPLAGAVCVVVSAVDSCPSNTTDRGVKHEGATGTCSCGCVYGSDTCDPIRLTTYAQDNACGLQALQLDVGTSCTAAGFVDSIAVGPATSKPSCTSQASSSSPEAGRLCCYAERATE